jgi:NAD(P)-dependent dehydrogenase (short-subunit alcohol dehydrogenase family)
MRERGQGGAIVNIQSINAHCGAPELAVYSASKAALALLTRNAANAHRFDRIRVNGINVGWTDTPAERMMQAETLGRGAGWIDDANATMPFGRLFAPEEVANLAVFLLSDAAGPMTGATIDQEQWVIGAAR